MHHDYVRTYIRTYLPIVLLSELERPQNETAETDGAEQWIIGLRTSFEMESVGGTMRMRAGRTGKMNEILLVLIVIHIKQHSFRFDFFWLQHRWMEDQEMATIRFYLSVRTYVRTCD